MSSKKKVGDIELDDFHYHEVVHTLDLVLGLIDKTLICISLEIQIIKSYKF